MNDVPGVLCAVCNFYQMINILCINFSFFPIFVLLSQLNNPCYYIEIVSIETETQSFADAIFLFLVMTWCHSSFWQYPCMQYFELCECFIFFDLTQTACDLHYLIFVICMDDSDVQKREVSVCFAAGNRLAEIQTEMHFHWIFFFGRR